jgi:hypothetical protein
MGIFGSMPIVSRRDRYVDLAALGCILAGAALCLVANGKLRDLSKLSFQHPGPPTESALDAADRARHLAYGGVALVVAGCVVGVAGAIRHSRRKVS